MKDDLQLVPVALRAKQTAIYIGIGQSTIWRGAKEDPTFPQPVKTEANTTVWLVEELDSYLQHHIAAARTKSGSPQGDQRD